MQALNAVGANIMIADTQLTIRYMNDAVRALLVEAEGDLRKDFPSLSVDRLIGSNIDIFHKNPQHQRRMLASLQKPHRATIWVGGRAFDLSVTPLKNANKIVGFVVEWFDAKARLLNLDYHNQMEAISRVQAIIEFTPDGKVVTANENFLKTLGYSLGEIVGQHHSLFVDPAYAASADYRTFWSQLNAGQPQIAEFPRVGKGGKRVVINASYNPIRNEKGEVAKIVKFATDVTDRVRAVEQIGEGLLSLAKGNMNCSIQTAFAPDFETLRESFNATVAQLGETLGSVARSTEEIDTGTQEISRSAQDLSKRTEQQAASLEQTAAALDEITANVTTSSQRADEARTAASTANDNAVRSAKVVADAVDAMARIEASSGQISNIIGVIDEIAFQTNLLALNAGVEAARAGEAGKGFAVVAQEVRELAQRSAAAAKEIKGLIQNSSREVETGVRLVSETGHALRTIESNIAAVNERIEAIASAAKEQSIALGEVNSAVNQMDQMTQQNAAMVEESTAASSSLASETAGLRAVLSHFTLQGRGPDGAARRGGGKPGTADGRSPLARRPLAAVRGNTALKEDWQDF
ncbi:PAS domain-containing methyl-accepting chemotaxis protein [Rhizobium sp. SSA_523]|uniref:methyl-accepting chemotaxis protein n=1 Tax=Rhizobium sp. SSA_523 TaxID=2952477 RepID=UPI002090D658|nr:PAS domain-containing methyl-accepting chemotaxis protein [Rhizobium sp. SSA_523]MCO5730350.1 methyl-accepting chemotaxis protein [Rhizobium sp. SSA_523]WKC25398.1 PAS domain-containing methyl-accepting chemotaxis protein [Rhizobium sp. SSA_523]